MPGLPVGTAGYNTKIAWATGLSDTSTVDLEGLGAIRWFGNKAYKWVKFNNGQGNVAAVAGNVCYYYLATGLINQIVTMDLTDGVLGAGVFQSVPADGEYCWIQIRGPAVITTALTTETDGSALTPAGSSDGTLDVAAAGEHVCAYAGDASAKQISCEFPF